MRPTPTENDKSPDRWLTSGAVRSYHAGVLSTRGTTTEGVAGRRSIAHNVHDEKAARVTTPVAVPLPIIGRNVDART